jgi:hypothetical protein
MYEHLKEARFNEGNANLTVRLIYLKFLDFVNAFTFIQCAFLEVQEYLHKNAIVKLSHVYIDC